MSLRAHSAESSGRRPARRFLVAVATVLALIGALIVPGTGAGASGGPSISGTAWSATDGSPAAGVTVSLYEYVTVDAFGHKVRGTAEVEETTTASDGSYTLSGLKPSPKGGYFVCFAYPSDFPSTFGVCWADEFVLLGPPDPFGLEQIATDFPIKLRAGQHLTGIDADMVDPFVVNDSTAGSISGAVTHAGGRRPLAGAVVTAFNAGGLVFGQTVTAEDGSYTIRNLLADAGPYTVCFDGDMSRAGFPPHRFGKACWNGVPWSTRVPPADASPVSVTAGHTTGPINADLRA